MNKNNAC